MALAVHWKIPFKSISGTSYTLNVYENGYTGSAVVLTVSACPFVTAEDNSTDILEPVRISTGTISIINQGDIAGLLPTSPKARPVALNSGSTRLWQGYLKQQQMTQPWIAAPYELQLPVVSGLGILDNKIEKGDVPARARIAEYLRLAIAAVGISYTNIVYPADLKLDANATPDLMFRIGLQDRNWFSYKNENVLDPDESRFDGMTWLEILTELMRAFGYTMYESGRTIYIVSRRSASYKSITIADLTTLAANGSTSPTAITTQTVAISSLQIGGADGTVDLMEPRRRVVVESEINPFDEDSLPIMDTTYLDYLTTVNVRKLSTGGFYYYDKRLGLYGPEEDTDVWTFRSFSNGQQVAWNAQDINNDYNIAVYARDGEGENRIVVAYNSIGNAQGWGTDWVCSVKSPSQSFFAGGYLSLHMGVDFFEGTGGTSPETHRAKFMLRIGDYYYNATSHSWSTTQSQFICEIEEGLILPPNRSSYETGDNDTIMFRIPSDGIYGDVELYIYNPYSTSALAQEHEAVYEFSKFDIRYVDFEVNNFRDDYVTDTNRFVNPMNAFAKDDEELNTALSSFISRRMGYGVMLAPDYSKPLGKIVSTLSGEVYLEENLVYTATGCYQNAQQILTIPLRHNAQLMPYDGYGWNGTHQYLSVSRYWADDLQYLQIFKAT